MNDSLNSVTLIGRIGSNPEIINTKTGKTLLNLSVVTTQTYKRQKEGTTEGSIPEFEYIDNNSWHRVKLWGKLAQLASKRLKKGDKIYIQGSLNYTTWTDKDEIEHHSTEILCADFKLLERTGKNTANLIQDNDLAIENEFNNYETFVNDQI